MRSLWLLFLLSSALGQGLELGAFGLGGHPPTAYVRLSGQALGEGMRLSYAIAPYWRFGLGEGGISLEQLYLVVEGEDLDLTLGRLPLTLGEGRLFPFSWDRLGPAAGMEGVWGVFLTGYGEARWRVGYFLDQGVLAEVALPDLRVFAFSHGVGVAGNIRLGAGVAYGEALLTRWEPRGLVGITWALEEGQLLVEVVYPWAWGGRWLGGSEGVLYWLQFIYREGLGWGVGLELEGLSLSMGGGEGLWSWQVAWRGEF